MVKLLRKSSPERNLASPLFGRRVAYKSALILSTIVFAASCGKFFPSASSLVALAVSPTNPTIQPSKTQQFTATGTFGDGSSKDVSTTVTWKSSATDVATINSSGLATAGTTLGSTTITASSGSISQSTTLTVSTTTITSITVTSPNANTTLTRGGTGVQLTATANLTGGGTQNITQTATWSSTNTLVATVNSTGFVTPSGTTGTATITAASGGQTGQITITVI
jgi:hypothetical protein